MLAGNQVCPFTVTVDAVGLRVEVDRVYGEELGAGANGSEPEVEG